jgi:transcriptional regulator with XRE-family HTH domain
MDPGALVGRNLARIRRAKGLTQEQLEELSEVSQQYVSGLEAGNRNPTIRVLMKLAGALDVSVFTLLEGLEQDLQPANQRGKGGKKRTGGGSRSRQGSD